MKYLRYNLNVAGQYLICNMFHTSYNPGAGFVFFLSHPQHMIINQHYIASNFNESIPNLNDKTNKEKKKTTQYFLQDIKIEYKCTGVQLKVGIVFLVAIIQRYF